MIPLKAFWFTFKSFLFIFGLWHLFLLFFIYIYPLEERVKSIVQETISNHKGVYIKIEDIPVPFQEAIIQTEDRRFYDHFGIDLLGITRSMINNIQSGDLREGGSTITQQLLKNTVLTHEKSFSRKLKEMILSIALEHYTEKKEILELYLNVIYFGQGAYGIEKASDVFFGQSVRELKPQEWTLLVGLPNAPTAYNPFKHMDLAKKRQKEVLNNLIETGFLSKEEARQIMQQEIKLKR